MKSEGNNMAVSGGILTDQEVENIVHDIIEPREGWFHRWFPFLKWSPSSPDQLRQAEEELLNCKFFPLITPMISYKILCWCIFQDVSIFYLDIKTKSEGKYVEVQIDDRSTCRIWTRIFNGNCQDNIPLVMIHGMGSGSALFAMNLDELSKCRTVYTIDLPGFARSSRCKFSSKPEKCEEQYVQAIENWRHKLGLQKFCLLGNSITFYNAISKIIALIMNVCILQSTFMVNS